MTETTFPAPLAPSGPPPGPRVTAWLLRAVLTALAVSPVAQPVLIGGYLDGGFDLLARHAGNAIVVLGLVFLAVVTAAAYIWPGGGRIWPLPLLVVLWFAVGIQIGMGHGRVLAVHVPLGVLVVGICVALAVWSWTPAAVRPRRRWSR